jgi:hypothetical protein
MLRRISLLAVAAVVGTFAITSGWAADQPSEVGSLIGAIPEADGSHVLTFGLKQGGQVSLRIPAAVAVQSISALSAPSSNGPQQKHMVAVVQKVSMATNDDGSAIVILPEGNAGPLEPLGIPAAGAENFIRLFQQKVGEARSKAAGAQKK